MFHCIMYLVPLPTYTISFFENGQMMQKSMAVGTMLINSVVRTNSNKLFILYHISDSYFRGNWIDDIYDIKSKRR